MRERTRITRLAREGTATPSSSLPHADRIQKAFGEHDVRGIQAHQGEAAATNALDMGALAYASGEHVVFSGEPSLRTAAHEAAHVVQQRAGLTPPGGVGRPGDPLERQADAVASRVEAGRSAADLLDRTAPRQSLPPVAPARPQAPDSGAPRPVQMINLGFVPGTPATYRNITTVKGNTVGTKGFRKFDDNKRAHVEADNIANAANGAQRLQIIVAKGQYPRSDHSNDKLLSFDKAKQFAPQVDHIVQKAHGGSNDYENARMLSIGENNGLPANKHARPESKGGAAGEAELRMYSPVTVEVDKTKAGPVHLPGPALLPGRLTPASPLLRLSAQTVFHRRPWERSLNHGASAHSFAAAGVATLGLPGGGTALRRLRRGSGRDPAQAPDRRAERSS